ncbi:SAM-dependent methyltransferase [Planococcus kocurii]|uniref:SAM-dependent methyltransferase n=1 Tax=Planococcus kocurii TaxID=1374 RepID=UPI003D034611
MSKQAYDQLLVIATTGNQQGFNASLHHNRYEPTPYDLLDKLFEHYSLSPEDCIVDVGCGKGRLNFYVHHFFGVKSVGIEMNPTFYTEALENKKQYAKKHKGAEFHINFCNCLAQKYPVTADDTVFYFFNPFSVAIFIAFVNKILASVEKSPRTVDVILFFASQDYSDYLETNGVFQLIEEIQLSDFHKDPRERFLIYRLSKMD